MDFYFCFDTAFWREGVLTTVLKGIRALGEKWCLPVNFTYFQSFHFCPNAISPPPLIVSFIDYFFLKIGIMCGEVRCLAPVTCGSLARLLSTLLQIPLTRVEGTGRVRKQNSSPFSILSPSWRHSLHLQILSIHTRKRPTALWSGRLLLCKEMLSVAPWRLSPSLLDNYFPVSPWDSTRVASL